MLHLGVYHYYVGLGREGAPLKKGLDLFVPIYLKIPSWKFLNLFEGGLVLFVAHWP